MRIHQFESAYLRRSRGIRISVFGVSLFVFALLVPLSAGAADAQINPTCWPRQQCQEARGHFEVDSSCIGRGWGRCYVQEPIPIAIKIPGLEKQEVRDIGHYIGAVYRWAVPVAAILAVIVIMVGGVMWITSAGADRLGKAKELIGNAIIGLLLAVGSYVILQTINPDLVRLTLPRTMMLRPIIAGGRFCSQVPSDVEIHDGGPDGPVVGPQSRAQLRCGLAYHTPGALAKTCIGERCDTGKVCLPESADNFTCVDALMAGQVAGDGTAFLNGPVQLYVVCADEDGDVDRHKITEAKTQRIQDGRLDAYAFPRMSFEALRTEVLDECSIPSIEGINSPRLRGFYLEMEIADTVLDDWFAVGACPGSKPIGSTVTDPSSIPWQTVDRSGLISRDSIFNAAQQGRTFSCDITVSRGTFPSR